jgi:dipeptidyl aminopeptidase/acylaminoacyl peptidase
MYSADVERRIPHRVGSGLESYTSLAADAGGRRLVATIADTRMSLWRMTLPENSTTPMTAETPLLVTEDGVTPRLAADRLFYVAPRGTGQGIWSLAHGTSREIWSGEGSRLVGGPALSPDGQHLAFSVEQDRKTRLYMMDTEGAHVRVLAESLELRGSPAWAPDGRSVVSAALRDGEPRLTRILLDGSVPVAFVSEYSIDPVWSPDGRFLVYSGADVGTTFPLRAVAADGRPYPLPSVMLTRGARRVAFYRDAQTLVFLDGEIGHKVLSLLDLRSGARRLLAEPPANFVIRDFDVSSSGSEIVFDRAQTHSNLEWIERRP